MNKTYFLPNMALLSGLFEYGSVHLSRRVEGLPALGCEEGQSVRMCPRSLLPGRWSVIRGLMLLRLANWKVTTSHWRTLVSLPALWNRRWTDWQRTAGIRGCLLILCGKKMRLQGLFRWAKPWTPGWQDFWLVVCVLGVRPYTVGAHKTFAACLCL